MKAVQNQITDLKTKLQNEITQNEAILDFITQAPDCICGIGKNEKNEIILLSNTYRITEIEPFNLIEDNFLKIKFFGWYNFVKNKTLKFCIKIYSPHQLEIGIKKENFQTNKYEIIPTHDLPWKEQFQYLKNYTPQFEHFSWVEITKFMIATNKKLLETSLL